jgi:hypothetical protein
MTTQLYRYDAVTTAKTLQDHLFQNDTAMLMVKP